MICKKNSRLSYYFVASCKVSTINALVANHELSMRNIKPCQKGLSSKQNEAMSTKLSTMLVPAPLSHCIVILSPKPGILIGLES